MVQFLRLLFTRLIAVSAALGELSIILGRIELRLISAAGTILGMMDAATLMLDYITKVNYYKSLKDPNDPNLRLYTDEEAEQQAAYALAPEFALFFGNTIEGDVVTLKVAQLAGVQYGNALQSLFDFFTQTGAKAIEVQTPDSSITFIKNENEKYDVTANMTRQEAFTSLVDTLQAQGYSYKNITVHIDSDVAEDAESMANDLKTHATGFIKINSNIESYIWGSPENNSLTGIDLNDTIYANAGNDTLNGLSGDDKLYGGGDSDELHGGIGNDTLSGDYEGMCGADDGDDILEGGKGNDRLEGGGGVDTYIYKSGDGNDVIYDYDGKGTIKVNGLTLGIAIEMANFSGMYTDGQLIYEMSGSDLKKAA